MARVGQLVNSQSGVVYLEHVRWCSSFLCKLRGLMFRNGLEPGEGLLMAEPIAGRMSTSIHMFFMAFSIATVWLDKEFRVVDKVLAKPWRPMYMSAKPAIYTLEAAPELLDRLEIGDQLTFKDS
jgi:uncharacterized membrane protein (UPF0127 family)